MAVSPLDGVDAYFCSALKAKSAFKVLYFTHNIHSRGARERDISPTKEREDWTLGEGKRSEPVRHLGGDVADVFLPIVTRKVIMLSGRLPPQCQFGEGHLQ